MHRFGIVCLCSLFMVLVSALNSAAGFYVIAGGRQYKQTILVSPTSGNESASGADLLDAVSKTAGAGASNQYLVKVEPGIYNVGGNTINLPDYVHLEGSGRGVTVIKGVNTNGVLTLGSYSEARQLSLKSTAAVTVVDMTSAAVRPRLESVDIMLEMATCSPGDATNLVYNDGFGAELVDCYLYSNNAGSATGVYNNGQVALENVTVEVLNACSSVTGILNQGGSMQVNNSYVNTHSGVSGIDSSTVYNYDSSDIELTNTQLVANSIDFTYGIHNFSSSTVVVRDCDIFADHSSPGTSWAVLNANTGGAVSVYNSILKVNTANGSSNSLRNDSGSTVAAAGSMLSTAPAGTVKMVNCYDESFNARADQ